MGWVLIFLIIVYIFVFSMMKVAKDSDERAKKIHNTYKNNIIKDEF